MTQPSNPGNRLARVLLAASLAILQAVHGVCAQTTEPPAQELPTRAELEASGVVIGDIVVSRENVFDLLHPGENNFLYRLANRWHILTREPVIRQQLLFHSGQAVSERLIAESERILRSNGYLYDAHIRVAAVHDGVADLRVETRDVWTLVPGLSVSRSGGENRARVSMSEKNLLGFGTRVKLAYTDDVDRESTSFEYANNNVGDSWVSMQFKLADNSDGDHESMALVRPFYALDSRWTAGVTMLHDDSETRYYDLGEPVAEYRSVRNSGRLFAGWSPGLQNGWVRRITAGIGFDEKDFLPTAEGRYPLLLPEDRQFTYPFVRLDLLEDRYETSNNRDQIERTEDFYLGTRFSAQLGYAASNLGSDRDALLFTASLSSALGSIDSAALFLSTSLGGRLEHGHAVDTLWEADARYYRQLSAKSLFFAAASTSWSRDLDLDHPLQLGGDNGLRGYPLRYQVGDRRALITVEQRYFTDWYPFRLVRVGGAVFVDAGRAWGQNPAGGGSLGWLRDVGFGLRLAPTRASDRDIIHIDVAFPLDGDASIDDVQLLLESKRSF